MLALPNVRGLPVPAEVLVAADPAGIAEAAAERIAAWLAEALSVRQTAHLALTGGSSASHLAVELLKPRWASAVAWERVHLWWGDERFVPGDHPDSNFGAAFRDLLLDGGLPVPPGNVHPIPVDTALADGRDATWTAIAYRDELLTFLPRNAGGLPAFDVILLGVGPDGHILSVFPGSPALAPETPLVMDVPAPTIVTVLPLTVATVEELLVNVKPPALLEVGDTEKLASPKFFVTSLNVIVGVIAPTVNIAVVVAAR